MEKFITYVKNLSGTSEEVFRGIIIGIILFIVIYAVWHIRIPLLVCTLSKGKKCIYLKKNKYPDCEACKYSKLVDRNNR